MKGLSQVRSGHPEPAEMNTDDDRREQNQIGMHEYTRA